MFTKSIPSLITISNLILGFIALMLTLSGHTADAALLVVVGMVLDGFDGRVARWLRAESAFGRELDSLSDIVTFGVAPAFIMYESLLQYEGFIGIVLSVLFPVAGALRLARFNVQKSSTKYFVGLPITAAGGILATMALYQNLIQDASLVLPLAMLVLAVLMVSRVRYPNFKKVAFPKSAIVMVPLLALLVYGVFRYQHSAVNRLIFIPLALYAVYGIWRFIKKRRGLMDDDTKADVAESGSKRW